MVATTHRKHETKAADPGITILLVDDDPDCRLLIRDAIAECKVSNAVFEVSNGAEALRPHALAEQRGDHHPARRRRPGLPHADPRRRRGLKS